MIEKTNLLNTKSLKEIDDLFQKFDTGMFDRNNPDIIAIAEIMREIDKISRPIGSVLRSIVNILISKILSR